MKLVFRWKNSVINFKDCRQLLNERDELVFKYRHKDKLNLSWLEATEATLNKNKDIDFGWFFIGSSIYFTKYYDYFTVWGT